MRVGRSCEIRGETGRFGTAGNFGSDHIVVTVDDGGDVILPAFEGLLERMMQSNINVASDEGNVDLVVQLVPNPRGGAKRKLETTLECEFI